MEQDQTIVEGPILSIPTELMVIVISFLSSRDRVKLRYVSQRLQIVSETPSLWCEFVWDYYDTREELCVKNVLKRCGELIKRLSFPGYLTPKLDEMLQYCNNVRHVSLPVVMTLSPDQLVQLGEAVQHMKHLHTLDISWNAVNIKPLFLIGSNLKELTLYSGLTFESFVVWVNEWVGMGFRPGNLNIMCATNVQPAAGCPSDIQALVQNWQECNSEVPDGHSANFKLYGRLKVPLNVYPIVPIFQLQFGQTAVLPFVEAKQCGIQGLDYLQLTDCCRDGKMMYKATNTLLNCPQSNSTITSLHFVTHFNVTKCNLFLPIHLEQLAIACPNLQRLVLFQCSHCLRSLQGLRAIASHCHNLQGLNISGIYATELESQIQLWEILCSLKLTHFSAEYCVISPCVAGAEYKEKMICLYQKCSSLVALESSTRHGCLSCKGLLDKDLILLCQFPTLYYLGLNCCYVTSVQGVITSCKQLKCFRIYTSIYWAQLSLSYACNSNLQQLCISSRKTDASDTFMSSVSAHGGLVHVFLSVASVSVVGIGVLIENSPELMTFQSILELRDKDDSLLISINEFLKCEMILRQKFHHRKLFHRGGYKMLQQSIYHDKHLVDISFLEHTNVYSLWDMSL